MTRVALVGSIIALAVAAITYPVVFFIASGATEAYVIPKHSDKKIGMDRDMFDPKAPNESDRDFMFRVMKLYGDRVDYTTAVVFVPKEKFVHPQELPSLTLLPIEMEKRETPIQVKSLQFFAKYVVGASAVAFIALFGLYLFLSKKSRRDQPAAPA